MRSQKWKGLSQFIKNTTVDAHTCHSERQEVGARAAGKGLIPGLKQQTDMTSLETLTRVSRYFSQRNNFRTNHENEMVGSNLFSWQWGPFFKQPHM